jgi:hypothetical protein
MDIKFSKLYLWTRLTRYTSRSDVCGLNYVLGLYPETAWRSSEECEEHSKAGESTVSCCDTQKAQHLGLSGTPTAERLRVFVYPYSASKGFGLGLETNFIGSISHLLLAELRFGLLKRTQSYKNDASLAVLVSRKIQSARPSQPSWSYRSAPRLRIKKATGISASRL